MLNLLIRRISYGLGKMKIILFIFQSYDINIYFIKNFYLSFINIKKWVFN